MGVKNAPKVGFNLNFLQKVKFMESLCLNYSGNSKSTDRIKYTTQIPCPCRFWNTPYLIWLLLISPSGDLSKFKYIWQFWIFGQSLLKIKKYQMYANFDRPPLGLGEKFRYTLSTNLKNKSDDYQRFPPSWSQCPICTIYCLLSIIYYILSIIYYLLSII